MSVVHLDEKLTSIRIHYGIGSEHFVDLYLPKQQRQLNGLSPVIILIHGGYWKDNHDLNSYATSMLIPELVAAGWSVWNIEYRRMDSVGANIKAPWPSVFADVASAVDSLRLFAEAYALDMHNISVIGHSAGGCLAMWAASRRQIPVTSPLFASNPLLIHNAISVGGVLSLTHPEDLSQPEQILRLMGGSASDWPERYHSCDPAQLCDPSVRTLIIHGEKDETVHVNQARRYFENAPKNYELELWPDADHFSILPHEGKWNHHHWMFLKQKINTFLNHKSDVN
ncbi:alpha/beta hydrolase family protein [Rheinheimera marina]|uniref:Alpha/beta hydrolase family protein n=1 Tax=Rheinheimera marina TaxID=1774958 RepID=A0ABV9JHU8_9GAMM